MPLLHTLSSENHFRFSWERRLDPALTPAQKCSKDIRSVVLQKRRPLSGAWQGLGQVSHKLLGVLGISTYVENTRQD